jgi:ribosomal protein L34
MNDEGAVTMTRGTWALGIATAVAGGGFALAAVQVIRLRERVTELDRQVARIQRASSGGGAPAGPDAELSGEVRALRDEVQRLHDRLRGMKVADDGRSKVKRARKDGFRSRTKTTMGQKVLTRRRRKGRYQLTPQVKYCR